MSPRCDFKIISELLAQRAEAMARDLLPNGQRRGNEWLALCPWRVDRHVGSFMVTLTGPYAGRWNEYATGENGDLLDLIRKVRGISLVDAARWAETWLGISTPGSRAEYSSGCSRKRLPAQLPAQPPTTKENWSFDMADRLWSTAVQPEGTLVQIYLATRGLQLPQNAPIRFHPNAWRNQNYGLWGPAMIALMTHSLDGTAGIGAHVTYLRPDGRGKAEGDRSKIMLGRRGLIRLVPEEDVHGGLGIAEGIEKALAIMQHSGWQPVWSAGSANGIRDLPVMSGIDALTVFADQDLPGLEAARTCCERWMQAGCQARIVAPPEGDWDDALANFPRRS